MEKTLFTPIELGSATLKNRIIFAPTTLGLRGEEELRKLREIAAGGCAMIIIGDVPVSPRGIFSLRSKSGFARYRRLCEAIHDEGCLVCAQLHQSDSDFKSMLKYLPKLFGQKTKREELRSLMNGQIGAYITGLPAQKVKDITASFGPAAILAKKAGFDMIQVHGDRMCGSFSSAIFNQRTDEYGGSPENRSLFAVKAVEAVRQALPDMPIDYKLAVRQDAPHYGNAGVVLDELPVFVPLLEAAGVTSFHVTLANHSSLTDTIPPRDHPYFSEEGCFLRYCDEVRKYTSLPICGVGGLTDPDFAALQIAEERVDCVAMSRQLIADPAWPQKVQQGHADSINRCARCNKECLGGIQQHRGVHCVYDKKGQDKP